MSPSNRYPVFSDRVRRLAMARRMSQSDVGRVCGVTPQSAQRWFTGLSLPRPQFLPPLASALGVTVDELVEGQPEFAEAMRAAEALHFAHEAGPPAVIPPDESSPAVEMHALERSTLALDKARRGFQSALSAALSVVGVALAENLAWAGFETRQYSRPAATDLIAEDAHGNTFAVDIHLHPPTPADAVRASRADAEGPRRVFAYPFLCREDDVSSLHFLFLPVAFFGDKEKLPLARIAANWLPEHHPACEDTPEELRPYIDNFDLASLF